MIGTCKDKGHLFAELSSIYFIHSIIKNIALQHLHKPMVAEIRVMTNRVFRNQ